MLFQFFWGYLAMKMRTTTCFNKSNKWKDLSCCFKYLFSGSTFLFVSSSFINSLLPWFDQLYSILLLGYLPRFGPCFINFYGSTREYSDLPDEFDDLNIGVVSPHEYKSLIVYTLTVHQLFSLARSLARYWSQSITWPHMPSDNNLKFVNLMSSAMKVFV